MYYVKMIWYGGRMEILIYEQKHYGVDEITKSFRKLFYNVDKITLEMKDNLYDNVFREKLMEVLENKKYDFVFSFNFYPIISNVCDRAGIKYVSWVYDSPLISLYSYTIINKCNYVFLFDREVFFELKNVGINTVYYLPLAVDTERLDNYIARREEYKCDISFVGSLYDEPKNALYSRLYDNLSDYMRGYLDALVNVQMNLYGINILKDNLTEQVVRELQKSINVTTNPDGVETPAYTYAEYFLSRRVTELERKKIIEELSAEHQFYLYTRDDAKKIGLSTNKGPVDYYDNMPYVFKNSKINLNITLKSIKTGIPLRVFDIMGSGGFLLTNYQSDMMECFEHNVDFVYYEDIKDLKNKVNYYLEHDEERAIIAKNGYEKVKRDHSYDRRVKEILEIVIQ